MTSEAQIEAMQDADAAFFQALLNRDISALETLLAEEFLIVDVASGSVHTREAFLNAIRDGMVSFREIKTFPEEALIRLVGPGTGIVVGRTAMSFAGADEAATQVASRYTHVFQADGSGWRLVAAQGTQIQGTPSS